MTGSSFPSQISASPYNYPHDASLSSSTTALVVIDMQRDCTIPSAITLLPFALLTPLQSSNPVVISQPTSLPHPSPKPLRTSARPSALSSASYKRFVMPGTPYTTHVKAILHPFPLYPPANSSVAATIRKSFLWAKPCSIGPYLHISSGIGIGDRTPSLGLALVHGQPGHGIIAELTPLPQEEIIDKPGRSAFAYTSFESQLQIKGITNLVLCGVTTDVCVHSTMREANDRGFDCLMVEHACAAATEQLHEWAVESVKGEGGIFGCVGKCEDVVRVVGGAR